MGRLAARAGVWICLAALCPAQAATLEGRIALIERNKPVRQVEDVVVYFRPTQPVAPIPADEPRVMSTYRKRFDPRVLVIPVGGQVQFPNRDPILHNAFSVSRSNRFDIGLFGEGEGDQVQFDNPGLVRVFCNVHQAMVGHILVLDTPYFVKAGSDGRFRLEGMPDGPGKFYVWHERAGKPLIMDIQLPAADDLALELSLTKRRIPNHRNKHGKSYRDERRRY
jgi:plastocyanin